MSDDRLSAEDLDRLARYLSDTLAEDERSAFESELLSRDELADAFYSELNLDESLRAAARERSGVAVQSTAASFGAAPGVRDGATQATKTRFWQRFTGPRFLIPLAAGLAAVLALTFLRPSEPTFRGKETSSRLLAPVGSVKAVPERFVWTRCPGAVRYRFVLQDASFTSIADTIVTDTTIVTSRVLPASVDRGLWRVTPIRGDGSLLDSSAPAQFRIEP